LVFTFLLFSILDARSSTQKVLYTFTGGLDGAQPFQAGVIFDQSGNLYGVTEYGGAYNFGTVFQLTPSPSGEWTETVLHSFTGGADGDLPQGGLATDGAGNLYGTTSDGGDPNAYCGTVFSLSPSPSGWTFTVLHTFASRLVTSGQEAWVCVLDFSAAPPILEEERNEEAAPGILVRTGSRICLSLQRRASWAMHQSVTWSRRPMPAVEGGMYTAPRRSEVRRTDTLVVLAPSTCSLSSSVMVNAYDGVAQFFMTFPPPWRMGQPHGPD